MDVEEEMSRFEEIKKIDWHDRHNWPLTKKQAGWLIEAVEKAKEMALDQVSSITLKIKTQSGVMTAELPVSSDTRAKEFLEWLEK